MAESRVRIEFEAYNREEVAVAWYLDGVRCSVTTWMPRDLAGVLADLFQIDEAGAAPEAAVGGTEVHIPYDDDGVLYCGWHTGRRMVDGCGYAWPCPSQAPNQLPAASTRTEQAPSEPVDDLMAALRASLDRFKAERRESKWRHGEEV